MDDSEARAKTELERVLAEGDLDLKKHQDRFPGLVPTELTAPLLEGVRRCLTAGLSLREQGCSPDQLFSMDWAGWGACP